MIFNVEYEVLNVIHRLPNLLFYVENASSKNVLTFFKREPRTNINRDNR